MSRPSRVGAIYRKELINILRDRRTMTAMVVIPVVLYPLLMLGFVSAAEREDARIRDQQFLVAVPDEVTATWLHQIVADTKADDGPEEQKDRDRFDIRVGAPSPAQLGDDLHLLVALRIEQRPAPFPPHFRFAVKYNEVNVHSQAAMDRFNDVVNRFRERLSRDSLETVLRQSGAGGLAGAASNVDLILQPVELESESTASEAERGGWVLGKIIPFILVLMTITGAIYPAIDLTAGERERGTLESLLVAPVPTLDLITGKFLVVATVGLLAAMLNIASVGATMHFGGVAQAMAAQMPVELPYRTFPIIVLCMIPFALLFAAILVAVCSFARTFKEAQNYVTPVILAAMLPCIAVTLPSVRLEGITLVLPVGNMVLLTRELFQQTYTWTQVIVVLASTTLYAAAAVAVATRLFGQEAVLFADAGSYKTLLQRRFYRPSLHPRPSQALLLIALLFPASFYANSALGSAHAGDFLRMVGWLAGVQFLGLFIVVPLLLLAYLKIDVAETFRLRRPPARAWIGAALLGVSSWAMAHEFILLQAHVIPPSAALVESYRQIAEQVEATPLWVLVLLLAIVPAVSEELLFRGYLLSGLAGGLRKWPAILSVAAIFAVFHFVLDKVPLTFLLGMVLAYLCWQGRSVFPCMLFHAMHNGLMAVLMRIPSVAGWLGMPAEADAMDAHLPARILVPAAVIFVLAIASIASLRRENVET